VAAKHAVLCVAHACSVSSCCPHSPHWNTLAAAAGGCGGCGGCFGFSCFGFGLGFGCFGFGFI